jgi:hypothetical protein
MITHGEKRYLVVNASMFGHPSEPGERVDWSAPDLFTPADFHALGLGDAATYAAENPHMIVALA